MKLHSLLACFDETPSEWLLAAAPGVHVTSASMPLGERKPFKGERDVVGGGAPPARAPNGSDARRARVDAKKRTREEGHGGRASRARGRTRNRQTCSILTTDMSCVTN
jgi:hypothetical protein